MKLLQERANELTRPGAPRIAVVAQSKAFASGFMKGLGVSPSKWRYISRAGQLDGHNGTLVIAGRYDVFADAQWRERMKILTALAACVASRHTRVEHWG